MNRPTLNDIAYWGLALLILLVIIMVSSILEGCATDAVQTPIITSVQTQRVNVPVPVPCMITVPSRPVTAMPAPDADVARKAAGASADVRELNRHIDKLEAAIKGCAPAGQP